MLVCLNSLTFGMQFVSSPGPCNSHSKIMFFWRIFEQFWETCIRLLNVRQHKVYYFLTLKMVPFILYIPRYILLKCHATCKCEQTHCIIIQVQMGFWHFLLKIWRHFLIVKVNISKTYLVFFHDKPKTIKMYFSKPQSQGKIFEAS